MLIRKGAGSFKCNFRWFEHLPCLDMEMLGHVDQGDDSVLVFLDGIASCHLDTICIPIRTIDLQKGVLKYSYLKG